MTKFKFELGDSVKMILSDETGKVVGRADHIDDSNEYSVWYKTADGRQVDEWLPEYQIEAVVVNDNDTAGTPDIEVPKVEYDFDAMVFNLELAEVGNLGNAFLWSSTPQGHFFWLDLATNVVTAEGKAVLDDMIAQYKAKKTAGAEAEEFKLEVGKYYEDRGGNVVGPLKYDGHDVFPFDCPDSGRCWTVTGRTWSDFESHGDLIKEVAAPTAKAEAA